MEQPEHHSKSRTKTIVGGLLAAGLALTGTVAVAARGPDGGDYGGDYGYAGSNGRKNGHRLHCPSYNGMYHSKGRATCHMAPRRAGVGSTSTTVPDDTEETDGTVEATSAPESRSTGVNVAGHTGPPPPGQVPAVNGQPNPGPAGHGAKGPKPHPGANAGNGEPRGNGPKQH